MHLYNVTAASEIQYPWFALCVVCSCVCAFSRELQECVPSQFYSKQGPQQWLNMTTQHMQQVQPLNPNQARAQFLGKTVDLSFPIIK